MVTTSVDLLAGELRLAVTRTARRLRQEAGGPLTPTLTAALATLANHGPLTPSELARRERIQRPTATKLIARLEADGLVERGEDPFDGRSSLDQREQGGCRAAAGGPHREGRLPGRQAQRAQRRGPGDARPCRGRAGGAARVLSRALTSLTLPNYRRYFAGQVISLSGNWMQTVAEMWLVVQLTGSGVAVGLTAALQFLPMLVLGAYGGVLADRLDKRRLLMITQGSPRSRRWRCSPSSSRAARRSRWSTRSSSCAASSTPSTTRRGRRSSPSSSAPSASSTPSRSTASSSTRRASAARRGGRDHRRRRRRSVLRRQRPVLRGDVRRAAGDGRAGAAAGPPGRAGQRPDPRRGQGGLARGPSCASRSR